MYITILLILVVILSLVQLTVLSLRKPLAISEPLDHLRTDLLKKDEVINRTLREELALSRQEATSRHHHVQSHLGETLDRFGQHQTNVFELVNTQISDLVNANEQRFIRMESSTVQALEKVAGVVTEQLSKMNADNHAQLEKMRETVDEKLHKTLEDRLGRSFKIVSQNLEMVQKGLGEMQHLANGVGDLKKVLANVKTRGVLGEIQLFNIIEDLLTTDQYELNCITIPGKNTRVEVAIKMPGQHAGEDSFLYLPVDSKFPMDKYEYLCDAYEAGCPEQIAFTTKDLERTILQFAKDIRSKYVSPPYTTDFAIMFLPVEGLYAEVSRHNNLITRLRNEHQIMVAGPSNLSAFLSSLQMGFRTLAIEKRSSEVWTMLSEIKTEFGKFGEALEKVQKKLTEAHNVIEKAGVRKRAVERKLSRVEDLPQLPTEAAGIAPADLAH